MSGSATSKRLISNTVFVYSRSLFKLVLGLWASRWVLDGLGHEDFGLFAVIGSILLFITFLNTVLSGSASRHIAYAIGEGDVVEVEKWFNAALSVHICMAVFLVMVGWLMGEYCITHYLTIPQGRDYTALWVFRISLVSLFVTMVSVPFLAMFVAKQRMGELSLWAMLETVLAFILAFSLGFCEFDRLLYYALCMTGIIIFVRCGQVFRAKTVFEECHIDFAHWFNKKKIREIFSFASWNLIGSLGLVLRDHGTAILVNFYFGTRVNAAFGIARQVSLHTGSLANSLLNALNPEIVSREGRGDRQGVIDLSLRTSKLSTLLVLLFVVPLSIEIDYVLYLWLTSPPEYTADLIVFILFTFVIDRLTTGNMMAVNARGRIAGYQTTVGLLELSTVFVVWFFYHIGYGPVAAGVAFMLTMACCSIGRVLWVKKMMGVGFVIWIKKVLLPCFWVWLCSSVVGIIVQEFMRPSFGRLLLVAVSCFLMFMIVTWFVGLDAKEKGFSVNLINQVFKKLLQRRIP